ncbi:hypothetical protein GGR56DRAFT_28374 [Xylariaceae sp. FL0804]|nr:hypothetical protein GGR56DRAFT_28374 [Xylariaceae sp. FL0804]
MVTFESSASAAVGECQARGMAARDGAATRFSNFSALPPELRHIIWAFALPPDVPELHVLQVHKIRPTTASPSASGMDMDEPCVPLVHTAYPVLMHVCHESRRIAVSQTDLRQSPEARCLVPVRRFRPDLDVLYVSWFGFMAFCRRPDFFIGDMVASLRHVAVDVALTSYPERLLEIFRHLRSLQTLHVVFGSTRPPLFASDALSLEMPPRRSVLKPFSASALKGMVRGGPTTRPRPLDWYLQYVHGELYATLELFKSSRVHDNSHGGDLGVDFEKGELKLRLVADAFTEFRYSTDGAHWVEKGRTNTCTNLVWGGMDWQ